MPNPCPLSTLDTEEGGQVPAAPSSYLLLAAIVALRVGQRNGRKVIGRGKKKACIGSDRWGHSPAARRASREPNVRPACNRGTCSREKNMGGGERLSCRAPHGG